MGSFYGNIKAGPRVSLIFDRTYPNRAAMEDAIDTTKNSASGQINGDGIYNTRYVFVDYGERHYSPYISVEIQEKWHKDNQFTNDCPPLYVYKIGSSIQLLTDSPSVNSSLRIQGAYQPVDLNNDKYNNSYRYYVLRNDIVVDSPHNLTPDGIDENCEYAINKEIDKARYQDNYDHTVWQKIWCSVSDTSTVTEKYIMVANLDAKAPKFKNIVDAPYDGDEYELATFVYEDGSPVSLSPLNVYYHIIDGIEIGEGNETDTIPQYEEIDLSVIKQWNDIDADNQENVQNALQAVINKELIIQQTYQTFVFAEDHDPDNVEGYEEYIKALSNEQPEGWQVTLSELNRAFNEYKALYNTWKNERLTTFNNLVQAFKNQYGDLYIGSLYQYKAITSDIEDYVPLVDENGNQKIYSQNVLDGMITSLGNIYSKDALSETYTLLSIGSVYREVTDNNLKIEYFHKEYKEAGYISEALFNRLRGIPQQLYWIKNNQYEEISDENVYDSQEKYYQRVSSRFNGGPHIDTLHSTDLEYKLHSPRNWKFNVNSDFHFNAAGFKPERQSYLKNRKNSIYLKKTSSGELYPVHMDNKGYKLLNKLLESGQYSNAKTGEKVQLPEAGFYVKNELKYAEQVDQRTFDFNLPEFGNLASKMWDLVYPRGEWIEYNKLPNWVDYDDEVYQRDELYYRDPNNPNRYIQVGKNDNLERNVQYYIFQPADEDTTEAFRYMFVGNDRAINEDDYPTTIAELIRYIYKILGLKTDNDYRDVPSEETIWGIYNGLSELLGKWTDNYELNRYVPIATRYSASVEPSREIVLYGLSGDFKFGRIHTKDKFKELHNGAFGPLYIAREGFPKWGEPVDQSKPVENVQYFYKDSNGEYQKAAPFNTFDPSIDYYVPSLLYEKAVDWVEGVQYYRDMNSLWGLLREFQRCRDDYQSDWAQDIPGSPNHIQHRPGVVYSTEKAATIEYNKDTFYGDNSYSLINTIQDQDSLNSAYNELASNECLMVYYLDEQTEAPQYELVVADSQYITNAKYYKLDKKDYLLEEHNIDGLWAKILINPSDKEDYYDNDEQIFNIAYYSSSEILSIFD